MPNGNPIACNPLLGKGGAHQRSRSGERQQQRAALESAIDEWVEKRVEQTTKSDQQGERGQI